MSNIYPLTGGIHPPENKQQSLQGGLILFPTQKILTLPLSMHIGKPAVPVINVGDNIKKGQLIATADGVISASVNSPVSGTIKAIDNFAIAHPASKNIAKAPCIQIENDGLDVWHENCQPLTQYQKRDKQNIIERLINSGIAGMGGAGFPTHSKLTSNKPINRLIINAAECEPYITADHCLMLNYPEKIIEGAKILAYCLSTDATTPKITIGVEDNKADAIKKLQQLIKDECHIEVISFPTLYPSGGEKQLIQILTGTEIASGKLPVDHGIVMQNVGTTKAVYDAIIEGIPLISRITTAVGKKLHVNANFEVALGTPIQSILEYCGFEYANNPLTRIIIGGPMMGFTIEALEAPVVKTTNCLLVPSEQELALPKPALPCIRCGHCAEVCPASLLPQQLLWHAQHQNETQLQQHNLFDCIECGACSYVCPSHIPLVQYYRASKANIRANAAEKIESDKARQRFEARKLRLEQQQLEKEQRRQKRQQEAKLKKQNSDALQQTINKIKTSKSNPAEEAAKLDRQQITLEERIASYRTVIESSETPPEKIAALQAKLNNTQARLNKLLERRTALTAN